MFAFDTKTKAKKKNKEQKVAMLEGKSRISFVSIIVCSAYTIPEHN